MKNDDRPPASHIKPSRKTLRLTFRAADGKVQLLSTERVEMICPPAVGERPEAGRHSGFWMELRDANDRVLFHRELDFPLGDSVEVHSPEGQIRRVFGAPRENVFEVLVPDDGGARSIALMGESLDPAELQEKSRADRTEGGSRELVRFDLPAGVR